MNIKRIAAYSALIGGMGLGALGFGAGFAHAETGTIVPGSRDQIVQQVEQQEQQPSAPGGGSERDAGRQATPAAAENGAPMLAAPPSGETVPAGHPIPDQHGMASVAAPVSTSTPQGAVNADN